MNDDGKSKVWKSFSLVSVDGLKVPFVKCNTCNALLKWRSKDGTSSLWEPGALAGAGEGL